MLLIGQNVFCLREGFFYYFYFLFPYIGTYDIVYEHQRVYKLDKFELFFWD